MIRESAERGKKRGHSYAKIREKIKVI